jgi:uncharacterized membrane protein
VKRLVAYFLQGLVYIAPIAVTIYIVYLVFNVVDGSIQQFLEAFMGIRIPGLGIVVLFILLTFLGYIGQTIIARPIKNLFKQLLERVPILKVIYSAFNDLFSAFAGKEKKFNRPVLVKVNHISELHKLGFVTETDMSRLGLTDFVTVYFPHSYNFSGEMFIVPSNQVTPVDIPAADVMKFAVSGGVAGWD